MSRPLLAALLLCLLPACTVGAKKALISTTMEPDDERLKAMEANLRIFDEHPEYIDEMFKLMLEHPATLNRFLAVSASGLKDPRFASLQAKHLVQEPRSLTVAMVAIVDALQGHPEAQSAFLAAMRERKGRISTVLLSDKETLTQMMGAMASQSDDALTRELRELFGGGSKAAEGGGAEAPPPPPGK
jgi:hypothetical protein